MCNKPCDANVYGLVVFLYIIKNHALFACSTKFSIFDDFLFLFLFFLGGWGVGWFLFKTVLAYNEFDHMIDQC